MSKTVRLAVGAPMQINEHRMSHIDPRSAPLKPPIPTLSNHSRQGPSPLTPSIASARAGHVLLLIFWDPIFLEWPRWESHLPCWIQFVSYRVAFGFQIAELEWPRATPPMAWPPRLILFIGSYGFRIGSPSDSRYKTLIRNSRTQLYINEHHMAHNGHQ